MLLAGSMDEKIYQRQLSKIGLSDSLMVSTRGRLKIATEANGVSSEQRWQLQQGFGRFYDRRGEHKPWQN